jgi:heme oxygenase
MPAGAENGRICHFVGGLMPGGSNPVKFVLVRPEPAHVAPRPGEFAEAEVRERMTTSPIHARLRLETRADHDAVEAVMALMDDGLTAAHYRCRLEQLLGFYRPLESRLGRVPESELCGLSLAERAKTPLLAADVADVAPVPEVPDCADLPDVGTSARAFGCLYVLEGATLGGRFISQHVERALGFTADRGGRFFAGYGARTKEMWSAFCSSLAAFAETAPEAADDVVGTARLTFDALRRWVGPR